MFQFNRLIPVVAALLLAPLALGVVGCTDPKGTAIAIATGSADKSLGLADETAYYGLLKGDKILNDAAVNAVDLGLVRTGSPTAVKIGDLLLKYAELVEAGKKAKKLGDAVGVQAKVTEGKALYVEIMALVGGHAAAE